MKRSTLVQRLLAPKDGESNPFSFGGGLRNGGLSAGAMQLISPVCSFDYMGAAEFEFGAVPDTLASLYEKELTTVSFKSRGKEVYVICNKEDKDEALKLVKGFSRKEGDTKELVGLKKTLTEEDSPYQGWMELDNHFMFFTSKDMFEGFKKLLNVE